MFEHSPKVQTGDLPSKSHLDKLAAKLDRLSVGSVIYAPPGLESAEVPEITYLDLYEITEDPVLDNDSREYYAMGKMVQQRWCQVDGDGHWVANCYSGVGGAVLRARRHDGPPGDEDATEEVLWIVTGAHDGNQEATSGGGYTTGDRVFVCAWAAACKVIVGGGGGGSTQAYFARLTEDLLCNQSAEARLFKSTDPPDTDPTLSDEVVTVYDKFLPTGKLAANTDVWVLYFAPYQRWYVLGLSCM